MNRQQLIRLIRERKSFLCVGLDTDPNKIPSHLQELEDPIFEFNKQIIDATIDLAVAYKPNMAFYESLGHKGWISLEKTMAYLNARQPVFTIADAKRGDIGNSATQYAKAFLQTLGFDSVTVNPYMGEDTVTPFLQYNEKWAIVLAVTSNKGAEDFQFLQPQLPTLLEKLGVKTCYWSKFYEVVVEKCVQWGTPENLMFVVGATQAEQLTAVREIAPDHFLLVPGVGTQGGSLEEVVKYGMNKDCGLLVNASRSIIYASQGKDFAEKARAEALKIQQEMESLLRAQKFIA